MEAVLQACAATEQTSVGQPRPPILGLLSAPTAHAHTQFSPDKLLLNQELLTLVARGLEPDLAYKTSHTLQVIHTPGHAANHLCLVLLEDGWLFSGDHVIGGPDSEAAAAIARLKAVLSI